MAEFPAPTTSQSTWDACAALNLSRRTTWTRVVLPLAVRNSIGALGTYIILIYKQTALLVAIGVPALLMTAQTAGHASRRYPHDHWFEPPPA